MSEFTNVLLEALSLFLTNVQWALLGVIVGMILGLIPGMGGVVTLTVLIPFTLGLDPYAAFAMLAGGLGACTFTGSITGILVNTPGTASNAATIIDGYPLTQKGESARAIGASAMSSASGAVLAGVLFLLAIPIMLDVALLFGPPQVFWVVLYAVIVIPLLIGDRPLLGLITGGFGMLLAFQGAAPQTAEPRFIFGVVHLYDGVPLIAMLIGLFALAEIFNLAARGRESIVREGYDTVEGSRFDGIRDVLDNKWLWFKSSVIGVVIGAIPGGGGSAAAFVAYSNAVASSKTPELFGKGHIQGVIAPESANDAKDGGQMFPTLGLGIPGSGSTAVFLAAMIVHGIWPGPRLLLEQLPLVVVIMYSLIFANIMTSVIGLTFTNVFTKVLEIPLERLFPTIAILALAATFILRNNPADLIFALVFGVVGIVFIHLNVSRIPLLLAFILGGILETNHYLSLEYADGNYFEAFLSDGISLFIAFLIVLSVALYIAPTDEIKERLMYRMNLKHR